MFTSMDTTQQQQYTHTPIRPAQAYSFPPFSIHTFQPFHNFPSCFVRMSIWTSLFIIYARERSPAAYPTISEITCCCILLLLFPETVTTHSLSTKRIGLGGNFSWPDRLRHDTPYYNNHVRQGRSGRKHWPICAWLGMEDTWLQENGCWWFDYVITNQLIIHTQLFDFNKQPIKWKTPKKRMMTSPPT